MSGTAVRNKEPERGGVKDTDDFSRFGYVCRTDMRETHDAVSDHYDHLDRFYRRLWGEHVHHGLWTDSSVSAEEAVQTLVHRVARDATIGNGTQVCDIGCGYGAPARLWAEAYGAQVTGYTVSEAQAAVAHQQPVDGPVPDYHLQDFLENDLPDASMDAAVAIESLTHIRTPSRVFGEVERILRPGGRFVACVWTASPSPSRWTRRFLLDPIQEEGRLSALPTEAQLRRWAGRAGLTVERLDDVTPLVRRTWSVVLCRFLGALFTDSDVIRTLLDASESERVFARTIIRIWIAQRIGALRYGWLVACKEGSPVTPPPSC
jgi:tocopherol O-methyltransferase